MDQCWGYEIKALLERLESLKITEEASENTTEYTNKMLTAPAPVNIQNKQARLSKSIVLDLG